MKNIKKIVLADEILLISYSILKDISILQPFMPFFQLLLVIGVGVGGFIVIHQLIYNRQSLHWPLIILVGWVTLSTILNPHNRFQGLKDSAVMGVAILGFFTFNLALEERDIKQHRKIITRVILGLVTIFSAISLGYFFLKINYILEVGENSYLMGLFNHRLFGVYKNIALPFGSVALILSVDRLAHTNGKILSKVLLGLVILINYMYITLAYSTGVNLSLAMALGTALFFTLLKKANWRRYGVSILAFGLIAILGATVFLGSINMVREQLFAWTYSPKEVVEDNPSDGPSHSPEEQAPPQEQSIEKVKHHGFLSGREIIWKFGLDQALKSPIKGHGVRAFYGTEVIGKEQLQHFHSIFIQALVSGGIIVLVTLIWILGYMGIRILKFLFKSAAPFSTYQPQLVIACLFVYFVTSSVIETNIVFINRFPQYVFWIYMGYGRFHGVRYKEGELLNG